MALCDGARDRVARRIAATIILVQNRAGEEEAFMKDHAPWQDRTGNARNGLKGQCFVEQEPDQTTITLQLAHGMAYGVFLEKCNAGRYAIVDPTARRVGPELSRDVRELWS